jgi:uncharacterized repeat protein (TIGR03806 family)
MREGMLGTRRWWAALALAWLALGAAARVEAQTCTLPARPPFAGHTFPLDNPPVTQAMSPVDAYPSLAGFTRPVFLTYAPDGTNRVFVVEQGGLIWVFENRPDVTTRSLFLDLSLVVDDSQNEMGLLGLAFDPSFATNRFFYVNYTASGAACAAGSGMCTKIVRYSAPAATPNTADPASASAVMEFVQPYDNHNGGMMTFGPDGYLWIGAGDGGFFGDPNGNGQNVNAVLGKILRIDPSGDAYPSDSRRNYRIPPGNPYAGGGGAPEWWARGLRNPWRFSFDRLTGDLLIGDVGQDLWEEVDFITAAERAAPPAGGFNLGWNVCEATHDYSGNCAAHNSKKPVIEYGHNGTGGYSITGGYVYRGDSLPGLYGAYLYADYVSQRVWAWNGALPAAPVEIASVLAPSSFGEDRDGELYITSFSGRIYKLQYNTTPPAPFPSTLSATGLFASTATLTPAAGLVEYDVNTALWSDRALKRRWVALPAGKRAHFKADGSFDFPVGTALVKHFDLPIDATTTRRIETRVFLRQVDRWTGFTYRWNAAQTDATLLTAGATDTFNVVVGGVSQTQTWNYPSPAQCLGCHSLPEGRVLGLKAMQLNRSFPYPSGADNQIHAWDCMTMFDRSPQVASAYGVSAPIGDTSRSVGARARSYLASNCALCHQPLGPAPTSMDFRASRLLGELNAIGIAPTEGTLGLPTPLRIRVGVPEQSVVWHRQQSTDATIRMPDGSLVPDPTAVSVFDTWIRSGLATLDSDEDTVPDASDNCPRTPNASQTDGGGFGTSTPDGVGAACQCGDVNGDGRVDAIDPPLVRNALARVTPALSGAANRRCDSPGDTGECSIVSWARMQKRLVGGVVAAHGQTCAAALERLP